MIPLTSRTTNMSETEVAVLGERLESLKQNFEAHEERDTERLAGIYKRLLRIELALATSLGGLIVIGWLINQSMDNILKLLSR